MFVKPFIVHGSKPNPALSHAQTVFRGPNGSRRVSCQSQLAKSERRQFLCISSKSTLPIGDFCQKKCYHGQILLN
jgi:hypothetical protein